MSTNPSPPPSHAAINARAQAIWETAGRPEGAALEHWLQAERELNAQKGPEAPAATPNPPPVPAKDLADSKRKRAR
jgi:hypothetical protein